MEKLETEKTVKPSDVEKRTIYTIKQKLADPEGLYPLNLSGSNDWLFPFDFALSFNLLADFEIFRNVETFLNIQSNF